MWLRKAADKNCAQAQCYLGYICDEGKVVDVQQVAKDDIQAVVWYRKAAEQGDAGGQDNLVLCTMLGLVLQKMMM
jgi:TPR repeat protein